MTWRWKIFLLCNLLVVAGTLIFSYNVFTIQTGEEISGDGHGGLLIFFGLFLLLCMLPNAIFNIYCAQRFLPDRPIHESVKKLYRFLSFFSLISLVITTLLLFINLSNVLRKGLPLGWQVVLFILFWLSQLVAQIMQFQLPAYLLRQSKIFRNLVDSIGTAEKESN